MKNPILLIIPNPQHCVPLSYNNSRLSAYTTWTLWSINTPPDTKTRCWERGSKGEREGESSSVSGLKRLWDEWKQRIKERLHVWPCIILDILNAAFVEMGAAYKKWHCAVAERACGLNSMTNLSPCIILFNLPPTLCLRHFATLSNFELNGQF